MARCRATPRQPALANGRKNGCRRPARHLWRDIWPLYIFLVSPIHTFTPFSMPVPRPFPTTLASLASLASLCCAALLAVAPTVASAQMPGGSVTGAVTAPGPNGQIIKGANLLVSLWTTDATTEPKRD